jgi:hypothetical protein
MLCVFIDQKTNNDDIPIPNNPFAKTKPHERGGHNPMGGCRAKNKQNVLAAINISPLQGEDGPSEKLHRRNFVEIRCVLFV